jgi:hypothetical protein
LIEFRPLLVVKMKEEEGRRRKGEGREKEEGGSDL